LTAGSRLILAAAENLLEKYNGYLMYCDTDSVFVSPEHARIIQDFFRPQMAKTEFHCIFDHF